MSANDRVEEPLAVYYTAQESPNLFTLIQKIKNGLSFNVFLKLVDKSPFPISEWANFLHLSERTMQRYKKENKDFDPIYAEKILEVSMLNHYGSEVLGSQQNFNTWLNTKNPALGGVVPKTLLDSTFGIQIIKEELARIEHGVFA